MKSLILLALVGFVLAIGLALPFSEDKDEVDNAELKRNCKRLPNRRFKKVGKGGISREF